MDRPDEYLQKGLIGLLGALVTALSGWRWFSRVKHENMKDARDSRYEENIAKRLDDALKRVDELTLQRDAARDGRALLERELREEKRKKRNLLELLAPEARIAVSKWVEESGFAPFESGSGRRK